MKKKWIAWLLAISLVILPVTSHAVFGIGDIVFDPTAFAQMLIESVWWLEDLAFQAEGVANQVLQIEQGILMLENWALSLKRLEFSSLPIIGGPLAGIMTVFEKAQNAFYNAALITEKFEELYSPFHAELLPSEAYFTKAFDWNEAKRKAHWSAMHQQAHLSISIESTNEAMQQAVTRSEAAEGHLQAQQAGNQLLGTLSAQQNETNALLGTMAHGQSTRDMQDAATQDQAMLRLEKVMEGWTEWTQEDGIAELPTRLR